MIFNDYKDSIKENLLDIDSFRPFIKYNDREGWKNIPGEYKEFLINEAEKYKDYIWPCLPASYYLDYVRNGNRTRYENIVFHKRRLPLMYLTIAECIEGKGRFFDDIINGIWSTLEESSWVVPAHNRQVKDLAKPNNPLPETIDSDNFYIDLFAGECAGVLSWVYYLLGESFPDEARQIPERMLYELDRRILSPFIKNSYAWMGFTGAKVNNWDPWICSNILITAAFACRDEKKREAVILKVMDCLQFFTDGYCPDGGCDEGPGYWTAAGASLYDCLDIISDLTAGRTDITKEQLIKNICTYIYKMQIADGYYVNYADASPKTVPDAVIIYRMGRHIKDENMIKLGTALFNSNENRESIFRMDGCDCMVYRYMKKLFIYKELKQETNTCCPLLRDVYFPGIEVMCAREKEGSGKGIYFTAKGGNNAESHNHNDIGSFIIYLNSEPAVIDIGTGVYEKKTFSDRRYEIPQMQSHYHNLPEIGSYGQKNGEAFRASDVKYNCSDEKAEFSLNIKNAYEKEAGIKDYIRSFTFMRNEGKLILNDSFSLKSPDTVSFIFMLPCKPRFDNGFMYLDLNNGTLKTEYNNKLIYSTEIFDTSADANLKRSWGDKIYRVKFTLPSPEADGSYTFIFSR